MIRIATALSFGILIATILHPRRTPNRSLHDGSAERDDDHRW